MMSYSRRSRYSRSPSPYGHHNRSAYRSLSRSRSRSRSHDSSDVENPGNNLYVTGLSPRITKKELEKHFSSEGGKVIDVHLVADPWTRESRGFGFVTMSTLKEADRCIKYLNRSVLEGRVITVEKARRRRGRTPTPGRYLGIRTVHVRRRSPNYSPYHRSRYSSPGYSSERERDRSYSPCYSQRRSPSRSPTPYSRSPVGRRNRYFSRYDYYDTREHSISPYHRRRRYRSISRSPSPRGRSYSRSIYLRPRRSSRRSYSRSISPRRRSRRNYSPSISPRRSYSRSVSPRVSYRNSRRNISPSVSPRPRRSKRSISESESPSSRRYSRNSYSRGYSRSRSVSSRSRSVSRSPSPASRSTSPSN